MRNVFFLFESQLDGDSYDMKNKSIQFFVILSFCLIVLIDENNGIRLRMPVLRVSASLSKSPATVKKKAPLSTSASATIQMQTSNEKQDL